MSTRVFDSGATHHMTSDSSLFASTYSFPSVSILAANGTPISLASVGTITSSKLSLPDVYYIPQLTLNLISVSQLFDSGNVVHFSSSDCVVQILVPRS